MTKSDLKTGMIIETFNGKFGMVLLNTPNGNIISGEVWMPLNEFNANLLLPINSKYDIIKVYQPRTNASYLTDSLNNLDFKKLIWERPLEPAYPAWFKDKTSKGVVRFTNLTTGKKITSSQGIFIHDPHEMNEWTPCTNRDKWEQVNEPIEELTLEDICEQLGRTIKIVKDKQ